PRNGTEQATGKIEVFSEHFEYDGSAGSGVYRDNVRVAGTNLAMTSGVLTVLLPMKEQRKPSEVKAITAERNVIMDYVLANQENIHATGDRSIYSTDTGLARITGH